MKKYCECFQARLFSVRTYADAWTVKTLKDPDAHKAIASQQEFMPAGSDASLLVAPGLQMDVNKQTDSPAAARERVFTAEISDGFRRERRRKSSFFKDQEALLHGLIKPNAVALSYCGNFAQRADVNSETRCC